MSVLKIDHAKQIHNCCPDFMDAVNLAQPQRAWDPSGYVILCCARNWIKIHLHRLYIVQEQQGIAIGELPRAQQGAKEVSSGGDSNFKPSRPGQARSSRDLLLSLVPEGNREICGLRVLLVMLVLRAGCWLEGRGRKLQQR